MWENPGSLIYFVENIIQKIFCCIVINYQNEFRESKGLPKIGEGWILEIELFYLLKNKFNNEQLYIMENLIGWEDNMIFGFQNIKQELNIRVYNMTNQQSFWW